MDSAVDLFKLKFKSIRHATNNKERKNSKLDLDLDNLVFWDLTFPDGDISNNDELPELQHLGLENPRFWKTYYLPECKGLIFIKGCLTAEGQSYWSSRCIYSYPLNPHKTNIGVLDSIDLQRLRWVTIGYHHDWDTKVYREDNRSIFPPDLKELMEYVAKVLGFKDFRAEAGIINYYHMNSTLSGHTDHSEVNKEAPLFSLSLGQSALFLIGGKTKDVEPAVIRLDSGDLVIMSGESRLCYHGVARILKAENRTWLEVDSDGRTLEYLENNRININVRQVNL